MKIPLEQLKDLGFMEVKPGLFLKSIGNSVKFWRDYRHETPQSYAYFYDKPVRPEKFKEHKALEKIEARLNEKLEGYF